VACASFSREEEAKKAWLAKLDVLTWGAAAAAVSAVATEVTQLQPEYEAEIAWRARVATPRSLGDTASAASKMSEGEATRAWLSKLDQPSWGRR
jgi:hypothetical protein